ncbi:Aste57867_21252 [Aphanomyces stellatus]|uniref:Aste57867_21252 protein n=1 Tax=Aphanomyces stellatus TaxID=120398 RepID=A0A485LH40_9STRA|nr:hypothetical protein As57867_021183 [Aphanomyces stellatus]VFT97924.1 Aste57867_21252 [Aphanomyces stellatus]
MRQVKWRDLGYSGMPLLFGGWHNETPQNLSCFGQSGSANHSSSCMSCGAVFGNEQLVGEVLRFLDVRELGVAACIDRTWRPLASETSLWTRLCYARPAYLVGSATRELLAEVGAKRYLRLIVGRQQYKSLRQQSLRKLVDSDLWARLIVVEKWIARVHMAFALDETIPTMDGGDDVAYILASFAEFVDEAFHDYTKAHALLLAALPHANQPEWVMHHLALLQDKRQDYDQAEQWFQQAYVAEPTFVNNLCDYAIFMEERRMQYDRAEALYLEAMAQAADPACLDVYYAAADFFTFKRLDVARAHDILVRTFQSIKGQNVSVMEGRDVKAAIQYAEFLVYIQRDFQAAHVVFGAVVKRWQYEEGVANMHPQVARFLCIGLLSYAICIVFASGKRAVALKVLQQATTVAKHLDNRDPVVWRYQLTADCVVQHVVPEGSVLSKQELQSVGPLLGLFAYLRGETDAAMRLWSSYINGLSNVNSPDYAFAGYCTGVVLHLIGKRPVAMMALTKAFGVDAHFLQYQNLDFLLKEVAHATNMATARRHLALQFQDVLSSYFLAHQAARM